MKVDLPYVFIIGFNKTATRSLHRFFIENGFPSIHWDGGRLALRMVDNLIKDRKILAGYDHTYKVFSDMTFMNSNIDLQANRYFKVLDRDYPNSYFIYNYRNYESWIESRLEHASALGSFVERNMKIHNAKDVYQIKCVWESERRRFEDDVRGYFCSGERYLEVDIEKDDVCSKISNMLGRRLLSSAWSHVGKTIPD